MIGQYLLYKRVFSVRFMLRIVLIKLLRITIGEIKEVGIVDLLAKEDVQIVTLKDQRIEISVHANALACRVVLRRNTSDLAAFGQVLMRREYAPVVDLVRQHCSAESIRVIVDVGANIGLTSVYLSSFFRNALVVAIEPSPSNFAMLEGNLRINNVKAIALQKALHSAHGRVSMRNTFRDRRDWSTQVVVSEDERDIEAVPLATVMSELSLDTVDILKIDIEGHEAELFADHDFLRGLEEISFIAIEIHDELADRILVINKLQGMGFRLISKGETIFGVNTRRYDGK